ncbi:hypothetical protein [Aurantiacibacter aquimixticola]|uniref:Uncharacterized protein n=1 Tax=Aurantiacibacter aquimixticola TaxID=1958945 RepID=A0A419RQE5_9SPHN|nr:hypothetical protein [Aurantiacibacter aquimixticola]RJY08042.1 hypothetical protein D6201_00530 [Aurantiacibacter aquimixticola]
MTFRILAAAIALTVAGAAQAQDHLVANAREPIDILVNGQPVRMLIAPDAVQAPAVNAAAAERLGLEPSLFNFVFVIGPTHLPFRTDTIRYEAQGERFRRRTAFSEAIIVDGADGVVGPAGFPHERVTLRLRAQTSDDRAIVLPLHKMGRTLAGTRIEVGGVPIHVAFSFDRPETLVSATGGALIAEGQGGYFDGEAQEMDILYKVARPVRPLTLREPLMLGELEIRNIAVRTSDHGSSSTIGESAPDPDEIVVTARDDDMPRQRMYVGLDTIGHCASIAYDFEEETLTLMCPDQPAAR